MDIVYVYLNLYFVDKKISSWYYQSKNYAIRANTYIFSNTFIIILMIVKTFSDTYCSDSNIFVMKISTTKKKKKKKNKTHTSCKISSTVQPYID